MTKKQFEDFQNIYWDIMNVVHEDLTDLTSQEFKAGALMAAATLQQNNVIKEQIQELKRITEAILYISESINWQGNGCAPVPK